MTEGIINFYILSVEFPRDGKRKVELATNDEEFCIKAARKNTTRIELMDKDYVDKHFVKISDFNNMVDSGGLFMFGFDKKIKLYSEKKVKDTIEKFRTTKIMHNKKHGIYGIFSWYDLAEFINKELGLK